jgi:D-amino-acid dehydrogenase
VKVVVMGAGLAGVTAAWYLARDGHEVVVVDREPEIAAAASYASTGIVAASRAYPWSQARLRGALRLEPELWLWALQHWLSMRGGAYRRILDAKVRLARYSQQMLRALAAEIGFEAFGRGVLYLHRDPARLERAWQRAAPMRAVGFELERLEARRVHELEPGIEAARLAGALYAPQDEAADAAAFCRSLAARLRTLGVNFYLENEIRSVETLDVRVREIVTRRGRVRGDAFVCALGVMDPQLRAQLGAPLPVYPVKGYSATVPLARPEAAPRRAMIDESSGVALAPMAGELRITGGAELAGYGLEHEARDFAPLYGAVEGLFPGVADYARARVRACLRPMTPETAPRLGVGRYQNLWFTVGLGHMGFALAAGAARITADLVAGRAAAIDLDGLRVRRG